MAGPPEVAAPDRARVREAIMDLVLANGVEVVTAGMVAERARVDPRSFEREFGTLEDCYISVYEENTEAFEAEVDAAFNGGGRWRDGLRAAAYAAARHIRDHPREVAFGVVQMFQAGERAQISRERLLHRMVDLVDRGREELDDPASMSRGVAESVVGSIYSQLIADLEGGGGTGAAEDFVPDLMYVAVRPYLGAEAAAEELAIPPPPEPPEGGD
jgi:AcrR family transcriptional regulator